MTADTCAIRIDTDIDTTGREEKAQALAEKWESVIAKVDPEGHEDQDPPKDEYIAMIKDFLLDSDEPLALEVLSLQEFVILDGCDDLSPVVDLLGDIKEFLGDDPLVEELFNSEIPDVMFDDAGRQESGLYRYYSTQRPVDIGTYPNPSGNKPINIENFDSRILTDNGNLLAWGYLEYAKPLTEEQYRNYELKPAFTSTDHTCEKATEKMSILSELHSEKKENEKETLPYKKTDRIREEAR